MPSTPRLTDIWDENRSGSEILFAAAISPLTFTMLGTVSESAKRLSPGLEWGPQNDAGYDDRAPNHNDFRAASVLDLRSA